jgi:hypothetical protein
MFLVSLASWASACEGISGVMAAVADIGFDLSQSSYTNEAFESK